MEYPENYCYRSSSSVCEIEEEEDHKPTLQKKEEEDKEEQDCVYVAVGKSNTSMHALSWTLNNMVTQSTTIYLIHVFPQIKHIPNPLGIGMVPRNEVSVEQVESYVEQERSKRRELLQKFLQSCSSSKVKVDTILIESDTVAKPILDLIPILQIKTLVIGANKFHLRKSKSRKGNNSVADEILRNSPESCKVRIICEGKEVNEQMMISPPNHTSMTTQNKEDNHDSVSCICFIPKFK
ncbi:Rossmann-like alpha/beta/alpha sandwich fold [Vigna unguiculata]|uniref:Rossmann-like alpha/beta/alpha sandwich fold n=2 Tax=Vigna unguiculata TaxID=3917 RepID=A0A4D6KQI9_VIGUN|nr:Rossmann-like alpha/beta/alpha sandwich fold [Vigna unguiculata]